MTPTITVLEAHRQIEDHSKNADHATRVVNSIAIGEHVRQGDCYLIRIDQPSADWRPTTNLQLAPGVSNGSRHVAEGDVQILTSPESNPVARMPDGRSRLLGPQIVARDRFTVTHPEHAHVSLPAGTYQTTYQLDYDRQQAVRD